MKFERIIEGKDHLWAVRDMNKPNNELAALFQKWNDAEYLWDFFLENQNDLQEFFHIERISEAVEDTIDDAEQLERLILEIPYTENLDELFIPLSSADMTIRELAREKARNWNRTGHASWLRVYAIRLEKNVFVITGGASSSQGRCRSVAIPKRNSTSSISADSFLPAMVYSIQTVSFQ